MRRLLVLALTMALGLTALAAIPAAATSSDDEDACRVVRTTDGPQCLTDKEIKELRGDRRDHRDRSDRKRDRDDRWDRWDRWDDRDDRYDRKRDRRDRNRGDRWWDWWFDYWDGSNGDCDCLTSSQERWLKRLADDPSARDARRILRILYKQDCLTQREFWRLRRNARNLDESDLLDLIRDASRCDCDSWGSDYYWFDDRDIRRLGRNTGLNQRSIRRILGPRNDRGCYDRDDVRRLGRRMSDRDGWDLYDIFG